MIQFLHKDTWCIIELTIANIFLAYSFSVATPLFNRVDPCTYTIDKNLMTYNNQQENVYLKLL